jgi:polyhydroxybutyrate depolymerase
MRLRFVFAAIAVAGILSAGCAKAAPDDTTESIAVNGVHRTYVLHVPEHVTGSVPLILAFHGHGGDGAQQARLTGFDALADRYGFIVAYPDGIDRAWNDGRPVNAKGPDDLAFAAALVDDLEHRYSIDPARVYATGFSNGAVFSNYLACNQADRFAAIAPVSGPMPVVDEPNCHPQRAVSFLEINGTNDPIVPFDGGQVVLAGMDRGLVLSFAQTGAFWAKNAGCSVRPTVTPLPAIAPPDGTSVTRSSFSDCRPGTGVEEYAVSGGGHTWPGGPQYLPKLFVGTASRQLDASETIVQFFLAHPMK